MTDPSQPETATSFGFRNVDESERQGLVNRVFATVAERYDLMNDLMSGGLHRLWKGDLIAQLNPPRDDRAFRLLDVAGGTADVTLRYARASGPNATAMLCDISPEMIAVGQRRVREAGLENRISFTEGNAEALPFADRAFDGYTIAFGIRNVTHIDAALREAFRVLKIGGRFLCLEFSGTGADSRSPLRLPFVRGDSALGQGHRRRGRALSLPRREHPQVPQSGAFRGDGARCRLRARQLSQPDGRRRRHPLGLEGVRSRTYAH